MKNNMQQRYLVLYRNWLSFPAHTRLISIMASTLLLTGSATKGCGDLDILLNLLAIQMAHKVHSSIKCPCLFLGLYLQLHCDLFSKKNHLLITRKNMYIVSAKLKIIVFQFSLRMLIVQLYILLNPNYHNLKIKFLSNHCFFLPTKPNTADCFCQIWYHSYCRKFLADFKLYGYV